MGVEPTYVTRYIPLGNGQFETIVDTNFSNPNEWANPEGYASIENSKGTTILDRNFSQVYPGIQPQNNLDKVKVVPNPYIATNLLEESIFNPNFNQRRKLMFTHIPSTCNIKIYTVSGAFVDQINVNNNTNDGIAYWDLLNKTSLTKEEVESGKYGDVIPIKAKTQEVSGNRIIYGNFLQNFDIPDLSFSVTRTGETSARNDNLTNQSVKSRRTYQVGIVLADKFGRQSPVILSSTGNDTVFVDAATGDSTSTNVFNALRISFSAAAVASLKALDWAYSYKIVVKQTSAPAFLRCLATIAAPPV